MDLITQLFNMLEACESCLNITKYVHEAETKRSFMPVVRDNERWYRVTAKCKTALSDEPDMDPFLDADAFFQSVFQDVMTRKEKEVVGQQRTKSHVLDIQFQDLEFGQETYSIESSLILAKNKPKKIKKGKFRIEYQDVSIYESESVDLANKVMYNIIQAEERFKEREADRKRRKFLELEF